jgi:RHS repeat-associated protein
LLLDKQSTITDWQNPQGKLETKTYTQITEYDALKRMTRLFNWHRGNGSRVAVFVPSYNKRGSLQREALVIGADKTPTAPGYQNGTTYNAIAEIRYDVKGQREYLKLGNGTVTRYEYDPKTFRLINLRSVRTANDTCTAGTSSSFKDPHIIQDLFYHYDPAGNITEIKDAAFEDVFFDNQKVEPINRYEYDALYRLIKATGRENGAANGAPTNLESPSLINRFPCVAPNAFRNYTEFYEYDPVGNIKQTRHSAGNGSWTRDYAYALEDSSLPASNRLLKTWTGGDPVNNAITYQYDSHGSMLNLANVADEFRMEWDYRDMIASINLGNGAAHYQYDSNKQRTRKYLEYGNNVKERIYLGATEIYQRSVSDVLVEEIETLHLFDGDQRLLMVDQVILTNDTSLGARDLYRYTLSNHLGSSTIELNEQAQVISYEEYHPYGTSAYRAGRNEAEVKLKRYRYTGKERDEESGLDYFGYRYFNNVIGRWQSTDPSGVASGLNLYLFCSASPISRRDKDGRIDELVCRESNLFYDFDHYQPQSKYASLSNKASNLGFSMADENRRKGATEFISLPPLQKPVSLAEAKKQGEKSYQKAIGEMLGGRTFSEVTELNELWQLASKNETNTYDTSQGNFRKLIAESDLISAKIVREAFAHAGVEIIPNKDSYRFRLNDTPYRRGISKMEAAPTLPPLPGKEAAPAMPPLPGKEAAPAMPPLPGKEATPAMPPLPGKEAAPTLPPHPGLVPPEIDPIIILRAFGDLLEAITIVPIVEAFDEYVVEPITRDRGNVVCVGMDGSCSQQMRIYKDGRTEAVENNGMGSTVFVPMGPGPIPSPSFSPGLSPSPQLSPALAW